MSPQTFALSKSVLVVDEDENLRRSLDLVLKHAGYEVSTVGQSREALEFLRTSRCNLIIMDITTPENRLTLLPTVLCLYPRVSVMVFSAHWSPETTLEIERLGVKAHLEKPVMPDSLLERMDAILKEAPNPN